MRIRPTSRGYDSKYICAATFIGRKVQADLTAGGVK